MCFPLRFEALDWRMSRRHQQTVGLTQALVSEQSSRFSSSLVSHVLVGVSRVRCRHYISCMPVDTMVTGTLEEAPAERAISLALCAFNGESSRGLENEPEKREPRVETCLDVFP